MRRTSFIGALLAMAIGAVLAFAVHGSPRFLDLQTAGIMVMIGAAADLVIRSLISESPLLSRRAADVAAVVEPLGDPLLDAAGNPVVVPGPAARDTRPPLVAPLPGTVPDAPTIIVTDEPSGPAVHTAMPAQPGRPGQTVQPVQPTQPVVPPSEPVGAAQETAESWRRTDSAVPPAHDRAVYDNAVGAGAAGLPDTPESPVALTTITGRPVHPRGRGGRRSRRTRRWLS
jgi:hypothetical protein